MRAWVREVLGTEPLDAVSVTLPRDQAAQGKNFYNEGGVLGAVLDRYPRAFLGGMGRRSLAGDALCSAHAPFNFFTPLRQHLDSTLVASVLAEIVGTPVDRVDSVTFEQPSNRRDNLLGDNTAFDCLISARSKGERISAGIEVKFTEGAYAWGTSERRRMFDPASVYNEATMSGGYFRPPAAARLRTCEFKQLWRNMLLAQVSSGPSHRCYYVHMYPSQNAYQGTVASEFSTLLSSDGGSRFCPLVYEDYIDMLTVAGFEQKWISYLKRRYVVAAANER
jgi:hypothetical protein